MSWWDAAGLAGVVITLAAYAGATAGKLNPTRAPALCANFLGASLVLVSLSRDFNLPAAVMETIWALVALLGLIRLIVIRRRAS